METQAMIDAVTFQGLRELMGADFMVELIDAYCQDTEEGIEHLRQALAAGDAVSFGRLAHSIKSSSASLGALTFSQQARELEMMGKASDLTQAGPRLERLATDFRLVKGCLETLRDEP